MYSGMLVRTPFQPDDSSFQHAKEREEYIRRLKENFPEGEREKAEQSLIPRPGGTKDFSRAESMSQLLELVSPEDSALLALIVFLLCDNTENDVVLLGILLYVLLSK